MSTLREELGDKLVRRMARGGARVSYRGRCVECGHVDRLEAFRYRDSSTYSLRWCPGCGCATPITLTTVVQR
jgi:hypothetical protein